MKKITFLFMLLCAFMMNIQAQTVSEYGNWFYYSGYDGQGPKPKSHFGPVTAFPPKTIEGGFSHQVTLSVKEKAKMSKIMDLIKATYPKPKLHSILYDVEAVGQQRMTKAQVDKRDYRFAYHIGLQYDRMWAKDNKIINKDFYYGGGEIGFLKFGSFRYLAVNINCIPEFLGGKTVRNSAASTESYDGTELEVEKDFTYKTNALNAKGHQDYEVFRTSEKDIYISITGNNKSFERAESILGKDFNIPPANVGNGADDYFVYRDFSTNSIYNGKKEKAGNDKYKFHKINNMVIMSYNNKLPLIPLTIQQFLNIAEEITNERIEYFTRDSRSNSADYIKNKVSIDRREKENVDKQEINRKFINKLREIYKKRLQEPAILNYDYQNIFGYRKYLIYDKEIFNDRLQKSEKITPQLLDNIFVTDAKNGKSFFKYDKDFYKGMADGEIRTIAINWTDLIRTPENSNVNQGFSIGAKEVIGENRSDNPDHFLYHFIRKMEWKKLEALLVK